MSGLLGSIGNRKILWKRAPSGSEGTAELEIGGKPMTISWRRDEDGLWIEFPHGTYGYDFYGEADEAAGGMLYRIKARGTDRVTAGVRVRADGESATAGATTGKKKSARVRAQMPGKIVRVLVKVGDEVAKDQPLLVMEAMKMENEIRALAPGKV